MKGRGILIILIFVFSLDYLTLVVRGVNVRNGYIASRM